ncbi:MAG: ZIP family metal transporter [Candidatus Eisenbacteria bacterium]|nr:ZIP family metal transporter [Candidatus Eisenbacteria bacterium]
MEWFTSLNPVLQALLAACFTWSVTAAGAGGVFLFKTVNRKLLDGMLGFAAGVMIAASFWSLLVPAIEMVEGTEMPAWFPATAGFLLGGAFLWGVDKTLPHLHPHMHLGQPEGIKTGWERSILLVLAITLHNIPEGLAVGVAFGAVAAGLPSATEAAALALALGIGIQNFPEGMAVSGPLRSEGMSRLKSFWFGQLSATVEPVAAVLGAAAVLLVKAMLPYALGFAAGAMIFVVIEELIPAAQEEKNTDIATTGGMLGFALMMVLDVALG